MRNSLSEVQAPCQRESLKKQLDRAYLVLFAATQRNAHQSGAKRRNCAELSVCYTFPMTLDELAGQLKALLAGNPGEDLQKNLRATLAAGLSRMDVVTRQEFDIQREMLAALRTQIEALTTKIDALEKSRD